MHNQFYDFTEWLYAESKNPINVSLNEWNQSLFKTLQLHEPIERMGHALHKDKSQILKYNMNDGNQSYSIKNESISSLNPIKKKKKSFDQNVFKEKMDLAKGAMFNGQALWKQEIPWRTNKFEAFGDSYSNGGVVGIGAGGTYFTTDRSNALEYDYNDQVDISSLLTTSFKKAYDALKPNSTSLSYASSQKPIDKGQSIETDFIGYGNFGKTPVGEFGDNFDFPFNVPLLKK